MPLPRHQHPDLRKPALLVDTRACAFARRCCGPPPAPHRARGPPPRRSSAPGAPAPDAGTAPRRPASASAGVPPRRGAPGPKRRSWRCATRATHRHPRGHLHQPPGRSLVARGSGLADLPRRPGELRPRTPGAPRSPRAHSRAGGSARSRESPPARIPAPRSPARIPAPGRPAPPRRPARDTSRAGTSSADPFAMRSSLAALETMMIDEAPQHRARIRPSRVTCRVQQEKGGRAGAPQSRGEGPAEARAPGPRCLRTRAREAGRAAPGSVAGSRPRRCMRSAVAGARNLPHRLPALRDPEGDDQGFVESFDSFGTETADEVRQA